MRRARALTKGTAAAPTPRRVPISTARSWACEAVAGLVTRWPCGSVHTVTGVPIALPEGTRIWPVCEEPSTAVQRTFAQTGSPLVLPEFAGAEPGTSWTTRATTGFQSTRSWASSSSTDWVAVRPASTPARTVISQAPSTIHDSTASARRLSGFRRQRHSHTFGPRNAIEGILLMNALTYRTALPYGRRLLDAHDEYPDSTFPWLPGLPQALRARPLAELPLEPVAPP